MPIVLTRVDDRLVHGQVVLGWGRPLSIGWIALIDDTVAESPWEADLYRLAMPQEMELVVFSVADGAAALPTLAAKPGKGIILVGSVEAAAVLYHADGGVVRELNLGGIHHREGRARHLPYVYLTADELALLRRLAADGAVITAQDLPTASPVPLAELA